MTDWVQGQMKREMCFFLMAFTGAESMTGWVQGQMKREMFAFF